MYIRFNAALSLVSVKWGFSGKWCTFTNLYENLILSKCFIFITFKTYRDSVPKNIIKEAGQVTLLPSKQGLDERTSNDKMSWF